MDEQQVEVALRRQLAASVSADRQQRHSASGELEPLERLVEDGHHPLVGDICERSAVVATWASNRCSYLSKVVRTNRGRHETIGAAGPTDAGRSASVFVAALMFVAASKWRGSSVGAIDGSYAMVPGKRLVPLVA